MLATVVASVTTLLTFASLFYFVAALSAARAFVRDRATGAESVPPAAVAGVSVLKPLKGLDAGMDEAFASHCRQDYAGAYELIFGVSSADDPAAAAVERLRAEFPERTIRLVVCPLVLGLNRKVSNLAQMVEAAGYDYVLVNDSDIRVGPQYLSRIMRGFAGAERGKAVGMVTAPYRGRTHGRGGSAASLGSRLEALGIATDFFPGVLIARMMDGGIRFGLGSTLAVSREALGAAGGFAPLADALADDYLLGERVAKAGYAVRLSGEVVETSVSAYTVRGYFAHQMRWARAVRDSRRWGYLGLVFTFGLPWALLNVAASGLALDSLALLSMVCLARVAVALMVGVGILGDRQVLRDLWLLPVRDFAAMAVWVWSFAGDTVVWRGERFRLVRGKLVR
jgi:ceramide glucosyltransferase